MPRNLSFGEIKERIRTKLDAFDQINHDYLNDEGKIIYEVYDTLDTCLTFAGTNEEFVEAVRTEIQALRKPVWYRSIEFSEQNTKIAEKIRRFVRVNVEKSLWENIPEFANRGEGK